MERVPVYCEVDFLLGLLERAQKGYSNFVMTDEDFSIQQLSRFLNKNAILNLNHELDMSDIRQRAIQKQGTLSTRLRTEAFSKIDTCDPAFFATEIAPQTLFFLTYSSGKCKEIEDRFGVLVKNIEQVGNILFLFEIATESFVKNVEKDWSCLSKYKMPCNSLIVSDSYILSKREARINLKEFLLQVMPPKLGIVFDLTIIAERDAKGLPSLKDVNRELKEFLTKAFDYEVNLTLILATNARHDRHAISNYILWTSGHGFELIDNSVSKRDTYLDFAPITLPTSSRKGNTSLEKNGLVQELLGQFKRTVQSAPAEGGILDSVYGSRKNRLLS